MERPRKRARPSRPLVPRLQAARYFGATQPARDGSGVIFRSTLVKSAGSGKFRARWIPLEDPRAQFTITPYAGKEKKYVRVRETIYVSIQKEDETTCGFWAVAIAKALLCQGESLTAKSLRFLIPSFAFRLNAQCLIASPEFIKKTGEAYPTHKPLGRKGHTYCWDILAAGCPCPILCLWSHTCYHCPALPKVLPAGLSPWVVLACGHWVVAVTEVKRSTIRVTILDSLMANSRESAIQTRVRAVFSTHYAWNEGTSAFVRILEPLPHKQ